MIAVISIIIITDRVEHALILALRWAHTPKTCDYGKEISQKRSIDASLGVNDLSVVAKISHALSGIRPRGRGVSRVMDTVKQSDHINDEGRFFSSI